MSYGGSKNPPWQRNNMQNQGGQQNMNNMQATAAQMGILSFQQNQQQFGQNMGQQNMSMMTHMGGNMNNQMQQNQMFTQAVSYPAPRSINSLAFPPQHPPPQLQQQQQQSVMQQNSHSHQQQSSQSNHMQNQSNLHANLQSNLSKSIRTFSGTGLVTKIQNDFGFIDDEIYFHKNVCVKGVFPKVGDRVLVEATHTPAMPFKWNASRIQLLTPSPNTQQRNYPPALTSIKTSGYNAVPPPLNSSQNNGGNFNNRSNRNRNLSPPARRSPDRQQRPRDSRKESESDEIDRKRRREEREKDRERVREKKDHSVEKRERSPIRRSSPKRRKTRTVPRYMVQIPKVNLTMIEADVLELRRRYTNLYVPSDFFFTKISWVKAFPPNLPFSIQKPCSFHIMHKQVDNPIESDLLTEPLDADYLFSAKVMLMGVPPILEMYSKCFATAEEKDRDDDRDFVHPTRLINFLVGIRGKNETMAIGGPWSKSVDGENPESDPSVLIKTAIRNCKALTGVDLSRCTQWYRFVELYYRRSETIHKGRLIPARIETVVIFLPDVRSCIPTLIEWDGVQNIYRNALENMRNENDSSSNADGPDTTSSNSTLLQQDSSKIESASSVAVGGSDSVSNKKSESSKAADDSITGISSSTTGENEDESGSSAIEKDDNSGVKKEPTHYSELDPKSMKVGDLRDELNARNLSAKGLKAQLVARLAKSLKVESESGISKDTSGTEAMSTDADETTEPVESDVSELLDNVMVVDECDEKAKSLSTGAEELAPELEEKYLMNNMTVIDEYDAVKAKRKDAPKKRLDDKELQLMEKRYLLPTTPQIIIHPSRTAKSGKFDCTVMSLSLLLDYRPEDTKEHSFEVSLFAELFNEMLMRDFGFNIYKAIYVMPEKVKEAKKEDEAVSVKSDDKAKKDNDDGDKKDLVTESSKPTIDASTDDKQKKIDKERQKSASKDKDRDMSDSKLRSRNRDDENSDDDTQSVKSVDRKKLKEREKDRQKYYTADLGLLLSFIYFDQTHCGYIFEKDIEELFYTLGLNLSRAQTRKLVGKVISRDSLYYRKLTDAPKDEEKLEGETKTVDDPDSAPAAEIEIEKINVDNLEIARGNKFYLPIFKDKIQMDGDLNELSGSTNKEEEKDRDSAAETSTGIVTYKGGLYDIERLLDQMKRSEKAREETEQILFTMRKQNADLNTNYAKSQTKIKDLTSDLKTCNRKLNDAESHLNSANKKSGDYYSILANIHDKLNPIFAKSEKSFNKSDSSRDNKEKERDRGDRVEREKNEKDVELKDSVKVDAEIKREREK